MSYNLMIMTLFFFGLFLFFFTSVLFSYYTPQLHDVIMYIMTNPAY